MKFSKREKIMAIVFLMVIMSFLYYRFVFTVQNIKIEQLNEQYKKSIDLYVLSSLKDGTLEGLQQKAAELEEELNKKDMVFMKPLFVPDIINELNQSAVEYEIDISTIDFSGSCSIMKRDGDYSDSSSTDDVGIEKVKQKLIDQLNSVTSDKESAKKTELQKEIQNSKINNLNIDIEYSGDFENCMNFIKHLETSDRAYIIDEFNIKGSDEVYNVYVGVNAYSLESESSEYETSGTSGRLNPF